MVRAFREFQLLVFLVVMPAFITYGLTGGNRIATVSVGLGIGLLRLFLIVSGRVEAGRYGEDWYVTFRRFWGRD
ncbi:hypothetical protein HJA_14479 [Hyphomonas jannaschiana VP2]|jgi:hypothetical protein|uniref:Uncharacterized protein n=1 Tax=Hyphomonas jannaschiana VP2 TaxID=1280952 RepID=A0A059F899_9PROT|nr:hypothetical protein HJA_14479 [Hyphomonas jannaschiana VP2]